MSVRHCTGLISPASRTRNCCQSGFSARNPGRARLRLRRVRAAWYPPEPSLSHIPELAEMRTLGAAERIRADLIQR
jgi:hypothetical protein